MAFMDFYARKTAAMRLIEKLVKERKTGDEIEYIIEREFGLSKQFTNRITDSLSRLNNASDNNVL